MDVFPTISDLMGLAPPPGEQLDGKSLAPVIHDPTNETLALALKPFATSQYMRCPSDLADPSQYWKDNNCLRTDRSKFPFMGFTIRTPQWRYTEWVSRRRWGGQIRETKHPPKKKKERKEKKEGKNPKRKQ